MKTVFFNMLLENVKANELNLRDNIQQLVISAVDTFGQHGDTSRIQALVNASISMRSVRSNVLKNFIKAHANVSFKAAKDGEGFTVRKIGKGDIEVKPIESDWFDFDNEGVAKPDLDLAVKVKALLSAVAKAKEEGRAKVSAENERLEAVLRATLEDMKATAKA